MGKYVSIDVDLQSNVSLFQNALPEQIARALEAIGLTAEGYAKAECPVDTGRLRNSISHARDDEAAYIGTNVEYAPYIELGTSRMKPRPYLRPAVTEHSDEYKEIVKAALTD